MTKLIIRTIESRKRQRVTAIPWAEQQVFTAQDYPSWPNPQAFFNDGLARVNQPQDRLDQYTPSQFFLSGEYPATQTILSNKSNFKRTNQTPTKLDQFTNSPFFLAGNYPATETIPANKSSYRQTLQLTPEHSDYTDTPSGFTSGFFPGSKLAESNRTDFKRTLRTVEELDQFTNSPDFQAGFFPGSALAAANKSSFDISKQDLPKLDQYTETSVDYYSGFFPGSAAPKSNIIQFKVKHQTPEPLDRFAPAIMSADLTAFIEPASHKVQFKRTLKTELIPGEFTPLPVDLPSFALNPTFKVNQPRRLITPLEVNSYPITVPALYYTATILETAFKRRDINRVRVTPRDLLVIKLPSNLGPGFGVGSVITNNGIGKTATISNQGVGKVGTIQLGFGAASKISNNGIGKTSTITHTGIGEESEL